MELNDSAPASEARSILCIDLNEIPSPAAAELISDSIDVVRSYHDHPSPPSGSLAGVPSPGGGAMCAVCGRPEDFGFVVVCDACERGFHVGCSGGGGGGVGEEWLCGECVSAGEKSKRWPLGAKMRLLDMNASPPSDRDADGAEDSLQTRKHLGGNSFGGHPYGASVTHPNILFGGNGFGFKKPPGVGLHSAKLNFEDILHRAHALGRSFEEVDLNLPGGKYRGGNNNNASLRKQTRNPSEIFLHALREFVCERNGELEEGWRVEFKQSAGSELYAVYCSPDGKTFDSVYEVACYLGLAIKHSAKEPEMKSESGFSMLERSQIPRKRKARRSIINGFGENREGLVGNYYKDHSSNGTFDCNGGESGCSESQNSNEGLPVQFEDFFLLSLGKVDSRPTYHSADFIWPVGYKSCWHDKISGSLFVCEILDGGDSGPVFKVKRLSCSSAPIPTSSTVLIRQQTRSVNEEGDNMFWEDDDNNVEAILSDPCPPMENDVFACLTSSSNGGSDVQTSNKFPLHESSEIVTSSEAGLADEIGEFTVEERSSSLAWETVAQKVVDACSEIVKRKGSFDWLCKHVRNRNTFPVTNERGKGNLSSLDKFSGELGSHGVQFGIKAEAERESFRDALEKWLDQDRFGLDLDFVQEILEQLPGFQTCSQYQSLSDRSSCSSSVTVGNGLIALKMRGGVEGNGKDTLFRRSKRAKLMDSLGRDDHRRPLGKKLCSKIPSELVGDVYQVWESLLRFHEILGLKEPISLEAIEEELISPWSDDLDLLQKFENEIPTSQTLNSADSTSRQTSTSGLETGLTQENPPAFIQMATSAMKEAAQTKLASVTFNRCSGVELTKAHKSLLRVLIGELQSKVSALVDPNFDSGESKAKRGRKKDFDSSISARITKLNTLPVNELTWPELARRYVLSVISMDGNLDSAEIISRESGKVFRCLQGDGGLLCGSLMGLAGMEADALLLAEAAKQIFGPAERENDVLTFEDEVVSEATVAPEKNTAGEDIPEWAQVLGPVRKLPTNVGTRIRKCVYEALKLDPPDWARKILEHSISKEVYKGNASGPTKKAVLSVLADVSGEVLPPKPEIKRKKKKTVISVSDAIMKQCRIVLRRVATADDSKVFCNLLGRKLTNSSGNDDEGLLGSPAMVSRPLDFRTIDMRLAAGSYRGSRETLLEDVRELWSNLRTAFGDQPELVELAETLAQNFESLYEKEVLPLVEKFAEFVKLESLNAEKKKEIDEVLSSISVIPKAPWDDGVCKVCGIDRDDDSVLLCDTCDAEYHTYCLNPPLARIPEGNWYCPSCLVTKRISIPGNVQIITHRPRKKYQGEFTRAYLEGLSHLAAKMEEKEYWEFTADERTFLLKFLCDELLNSAIIRQHIEQCAETSTELQQKLRSHFVEWKILKSREEIMAARASKLDLNPVNTLGVTSGIRRESSLTNHGKGQTIPSLSEKSLADEVSMREVTAPNPLDKQLSASESPRKPSDSTDQLKDDPTSAVENSLTNTETPKIDEPRKSSESLVLEVEASGAETGSSEIARKEGSSSQTLDAKSASTDLSSVKSEIAALQESINGVESELSKVSVRREFLGTDSLGCLFWGSGAPAERSRIIVDGSAAILGGRRTNIHRGPLWRISDLESSLRFIADDRFPFDGSRFGHMYLPQEQPSVSYQTDEEINELVNCLKASDPKEKELKESIRHWQKLRLHELRKSKSETQDLTASAPISEDINYLVTKATALLEKRHGHCVQIEIADGPKKRGKKTRISTVHEDKMYRCECLELVWPRRHHCISCHKTFLSETELEKHSIEGKCSPAPISTHEKGKEISEPAKTKGNPKVESAQANFGAKLIKFQDEGLSCPYNLEKTCSKFVTNDSCRDVIREIGLIGSNGVPSFVPSISHCLSDSTLALLSPQKSTASQIGGSGSRSDNPFPQGTGRDVLDSNKSPIRSTKEVNDAPKCQKRSSANRSSVLSGLSRCCVVPQSSLRPLAGKVSQILRQLKVNLLDMDAALPEEALRPSKSHIGRRWAWRAFVKSATSIYEMVQAVIILEDVIKTDSIKNEWWYWSSFSTAAKISTVSALALRIYSLDAAIIYEKNSADSEATENSEPTAGQSDQKQPIPVSDSAEKTRSSSRRSNKKRKEPEG